MRLEKAKQLTFTPGLKKVVRFLNGNEKDDTDNG
jgi:hypothetical protein